MVPDALRWLTAFNPMFYMVNGMRYGMLGISDVPIGFSMTVVFFLFLLLFLFNVYLFKIGFKLRK
jgi:ABC-2 type transport system permease protein